MSIFSKQRLATILLAASTLTLTFTACSDNTADLANAPSTIDPKQWNLDENMDTSVKPGDDFARYCWGKWYDAQGAATEHVSYGTFTEAQNEINKQLSSLGNKEDAQIASDLNRLGEDEANIEKLRQRIQELLELRTASNKDIAEELGKFLASGKNSLIRTSLMPMGEKNYLSIEKSLTLSDDLEITATLSNTLFTNWLIELGLDGETAKKVVKDGISTTFTTNINEDTTDGSYEEDTDGSYEDMSAVRSKKRRARIVDTGEHLAICDAFCEGLGVKADQLFTDSLSTTMGIGAFIDLNASHIVDMMMCYEAADILLVSKQAQNAYFRTYSGEKDGFQEKIVGNLLDYPRSKAYCDKYCTAEMRNMTLDLMEDIRTTFAKRIDNLEWMTSTTKEAAKNKLYAMKFFACSPDKWLDAGFPSLKGNSLYEDIQILRQTYTALKKANLSINPREDMFNYAIASGYPTYTVNCFYIQFTNTVNIFAPFLMSPIYSSENSDATLYAVATVLGHEMTHGFDNDGALYGPKGEDINWWTVSDKQDYDTRTQLLVDCFNHLPGYMNCPGKCFSNGSKTLGENIADLGGLELALQAYTTKLEQQGYYGDELVKQQKRFFQAYANIWRSKSFEQQNIQDLTTDEHANEYARVLGSTMNCDRWYELYNVQWGDKYYLHPEKRTHIW